MTRLAIGLFTLLGIASWTQAAHAQAGAKADQPKTTTEKNPDTDNPDTAGAPEPAGPDLSGEGATGGPPSEAALQKRYQDVVVLPRKAFLKSGRVEIAPFSGVTVNDVLIRHYAFGGSLNYFLSDILWIGVEGQYFVKQIIDRNDLLGLQFYRQASLNRYHYSAALNFGYAPIYGKFTWFNQRIAHWEIYATAGAGITQSEIIPRNPNDQTFTNSLITANGGLGARFFLFDWMTVNFALRDYVFSDKFEAPGRPANQSGADAKNAAQSQLVNNVLIYAGVGFFLPTSFQYRTPR